MTDRYFNLEKTDIALVAAAILTSLASWIYSAGKTPKFTMMFEKYTVVIAIPIFLVSAYFIYQFEEVWGGKIGKYLVLSGIGILLQMLPIHLIFTGI
ncbi:MAG: hypothetical protein ABEI78_01460 [Candidatus Nanohaloarchaea archaeon]